MSHKKTRRGRLKFNRLSPIRDAVRDAYSRLPSDPRERFGWAVGLAYNAERLPNDEKTIRDLKAETYAFIGASGLPVPAGFVMPHNCHTDIIRRWQKMIRSALEHETIEIVPRALGTTQSLWEKYGGTIAQRVVLTQTSVTLRFSPQLRRYTEEISYPEDLETSAARALAKLLLEFGHLVKECPAPLRRDGSPAICRKWFVATRPNNDYCSPQCRSRATTKRFRTPKGKANKRRR